MRNTIERVMAVGRFNMNALRNAVWPLIEADRRTAQHVQAIRETLGLRDYNSLSNAILRNAFLIEPVLTRGGATRMSIRWLPAMQNDQRFCSFDECLAIAVHLISTLEEFIEDANHREALELSLNYRMISHEACFDYLEMVDADDHATRIHRLGNLHWVFNPISVRTLKLRRFLLEPQTSPDPAFFRSVLNDKIKIKAYLTDRVQTGEYQTNREKRWEIHPHSVHFATRQTGMAIEYKLVTQICSFDGFPDFARETLQAENILPEELELFRCPITLDLLSFNDLRAELLNPVHGRSSFQVAHLNPLKLADPNEVQGHTAENVSWITADGNRIQGSLSLVEIRALLRRIARNYEELGIV